MYREIYMKLIIEGNEYEEKRDQERTARVTRYRNLANLDEDAAIDRDHIDKWALNKVAMESGKNADAVLEELLESARVPRKKRALREAPGDGSKPAKTIADVVHGVEDKLDADAVDADAVDADAGRGTIERALDRALDFNKEQIANGHHNYQNVLLVGEAGTGKTERVKQWAQANGVNLLTKSAATMDDTDIGGALAPSKEGNRAIRLTTDEFDGLSRPNSVLFLDEFNRGSDTVEVPCKN